MALEYDLKFLLNSFLVIQEVPLIATLAFNQELLYWPIVTQIQRHHLTLLMLLRLLNATVIFTISEVGLKKSFVGASAHLLVQKNVFLNFRRVHTCRICLQLPNSFQYELQLFNQMIVAYPVEHKVELTYQLNFWITMVVFNNLRLQLLTIIGSWITILFPSCNLPGPSAFSFACVILVIWVFFTFVPVFPLASLLKSLLSCWSRFRHFWSSRSFAKSSVFVRIILLHPTWFKLLCLSFRKFLLPLKTHKSPLMLNGFLCLVFLSRHQGVYVAHLLNSILTFNQCVYSNALESPIILLNVNSTVIQFFRH